MTIKEYKEMYQSWLDDLNSGSYPDKAEEYKGKELNGFIEGIAFALEQVINTINNDN